jgi:hypothetical protein
VVGGGAVSFLYNRNQSIGAMITLVLLILVFVLFGLRWFPGGNLNGSQPKTGSWPPIVNMCPDFMVSWKDPSNSKIYCYDAANIYNLKVTTDSNFVSKTINNVGGQSAILLHDPAGSTVATKNPLQEKLKNNSGTIVGNMATSIIRWEGVWDGRNVTPSRIPSI